MKCFYHGDLDGKCSGFWVLNKYPECEMREIHYDMEFPIEDIVENEMVFIVDFSIEPDMMRKLLEITEKVIWIDHHKSAIKKYDDFEYDIKGVREVGKAGCILTYNYLYPEDEINMLTEYVGDWDVWKFDYGERTEYFKMGMESYDTHPKSDIWRRALKNTSKIIEEGEVISRYNKQKYREYRDSYAYEVEFEGYDCLVCNRGQASSKLFGDKIYEYDFVIKYVYNGEEYVVSLYSKNVDVSEIAEKYSGGGHEGAAGFVCEELPF